MQLKDLKEYEESLNNFKAEIENRAEHTLKTLYTPNNPSPTDRGEPPKRKSPWP